MDLCWKISDLVGDAAKTAHLSIEQLSYADMSMMYMRSAFLHLRVCCNLAMRLQAESPSVKAGSGETAI